MGALLLGLPAAASATGSATAGLFGVGGQFAASQALLSSAILGSSALSTAGTVAGLDAQAEQAAAQGAAEGLALEARRFNRFEELRRRLADARARFAAAGVEPNTGSARTLQDAARRGLERADRVDLVQTDLARAILRTNRRRFRARRAPEIAAGSLNALESLLTVNRSI